MNLRRNLFQYLQPRFSKGLFLKFRHAYPHPLRMWRALHEVEAVQKPPSLYEHIVVVGLGPAAMACLRELKREGFLNVTVVAKDEQYGGKCVNLGCMPIEYALHLESPVNQRKEEVKNFVNDLRKDVEQQFVKFGYLLRKGEAVEITGKLLRLADGSEVAFDRLISAIGNQIPAPARVPNDLPNLIDLYEFWQLSPGKKVTIYAGTNVTALALGDVAINLGLEPTVLLSPENPFEKLPSFRYFLRELGKRGVKILEGSRIHSVKDGQVNLQSAGKSHSLENDHFLVMDRPEPRFLALDGLLPTVYDLDLQRGCLPERPDVHFLGDGGGLFTAAEAEVQARLLVSAWKNGHTTDLLDISALPFYIHAHQSLAMVGKEWAIASKGWREVDFRTLAWSKAIKLEGKLWYLLNTETGKVEGLQICHKYAPELICLGAVLLEYPVWDIKWQNIYVHPTSSEIFKILADQAKTAIPTHRYTNSKLPDFDYQEFEFHLPSIDIIDRKNLPNWINQEQYFHVILSKKPYTSFAAYFGLAKISEITRNSSLPWKNFNERINESELGEYYIANDDGIKFTLFEEDKLFVLRSEDCKIKINLFK